MLRLHGFKLGQRLGAWLGVGIVLGAIFVFNDWLIGLPFRPGFMLIMGLAASGVWAGSLGVIGWLARVLPLDSPRRLVFGLAHLALSFLYSVAAIFVLAVFFWLLVALGSGENPAFARVYGDMAYYFVIAQALFYWVVVVGHAALRAREEARIASTRASVLEAQLSRARLDGLRAQLRPHFLFNTFNTVAALVRIGEKEEGLDTLAELSELLRASLDADHTPFATLGEELALTRRYIELERKRFGDRLTVAVAVPEALHSALVPRLALQPLVENAIRHGIEPAEEGGHIRISAHREQSEVHLEVVDTGVGVGNRKDTAGDGNGVGLGNLRQRLVALYEPSGTLEISRPDTGVGTRVEMTVPWQTAPGEKSP